MSGTIGSRTVGNSLGWAVSPDVDLKTTLCRSFLSHRKSLVSVLEAFAVLFSHPTWALVHVLVFDNITRAGDTYAIPILAILTSSYEMRCLKRRED